MKKVALPLEDLSFAQKLDLMETLWADMSRDEKKLKSPAWHEAVLEDREAAFSSGKTVVSDWEQAKKRIKKGIVKIKILDTAEKDLEDGVPILRVEESRTWFVLSRLSIC